MPAFSFKSKQKLKTCDPRIQMIFNEVIRHFDCTILEGHREKTRQNKLFDDGKSRVRWPNGRHNTKPSLAVDVAPWPIDWVNLKRFYYFAGFVKATAKQFGINLRWGGDWDGDTNLDDQDFNDLPHFEIAED